MAGKTGKIVLYTPTAEQAASFNNQTQQMAAVITSWDEESEKASLTIFMPGASYVTALSGIVEGSDAGEFQQQATDAGTTSTFAKSSSGQAAADKAQHKADKAQEAADA